MKRVTIQHMRIVNFKGIRSLDLDFAGNNAIISGYNATGKSTIVDAFSWLLWNKNSAGVTRFDVRPRDNNMCEIHDIITTVEATLKVGSDDAEAAIEFTLRRDELEDMTKEQRAKLQPTDIANKKSYYFIDNAPYEARIFAQQVTELLVPQDIFMLTSNPIAFFQLKEDKQRELLFGSCGLVPNESVDGWVDVKKICGAVNTPEQTKEALERQITALKRKTVEIPARIDSLSRLYNFAKDYDFLIADVVKRQTEIQKQSEKFEERKATLVQSLGEKPQIKEPSKSRVTEYEYKIESCTRRIENIQVELSTLRAKSETDKCPNCGYALTDYSQRIEQALAALEQEQAKLKDLKKQLSKASALYKEAMQDYKAQLDNTPRDTFLEKIEVIEKELRDIHTTMLELTREKAEYEQALKTAAEVDKLRKELSEIDDRMADTITKLDTVKEWIRRKNQVQMQSINSHFEKVKFVLYEMQANGNYKPCCKATIDGISYANLNTAKKVYAGIEIAKLFAKSYDVTCPIWVDNTESIFELPSTKAQLIKLKADESCRELKVQLQ